MTKHSSWQIHTKNVFSTSNSNIDHISSLSLRAKGNNNSWNVVFQSRCVNEWLSVGWIVSDFSSSYICVIVWSDSWEKAFEETEGSVVVSSGSVLQRLHQSCSKDWLFDGTVNLRCCIWTTLETSPWSVMYCHLDLTSGKNSKNSGTFYCTKAVQYSLAEIKQMTARTDLLYVALTLCLLHRV